MAAVAITDLDTIRRAVTGLILPGQRRLHMVRERAGRRRLILSTFVTLGIEAVVYDAGRNYPTEREARTACLTAIVNDLAGQDARLVIEQDDSLLQSDEATLYRLTRGSNTLHYDHQRAASNSLLAIPDAVAWTWAKGGDWRRRADPLVSTVRQV